MSNKEQFIYAFKKTLPILFSYIFLGTAFGIMMNEAGFGLGYSALTSIVVYTGAFQLALVGLLKGGASVFSIVMTALAMGSRHIFYGFSFLEDFRKDKKRFPYLVFSLTDEVYALDCALEEPKNSNRQLIEFYMAIMCHLYWITGSIIGSLAGALIPFDFTGIDFCMTALFITIFIDQWNNFSKLNKGFYPHIPAVLGGVLSIVLLILVGPSNFILPSLVITTAILLIMSKVELTKTEEEEG